MLYYRTQRGTLRSRAFIPSTYDWIRTHSLSHDNSILVLEIFSRGNIIETPSQAMLCKSIERSPPLRTSGLFLARPNHHRTSIFSAGCAPHDFFFHEIPICSRKKKHFKNQPLFSFHSLVVTGHLMSSSSCENRPRDRLLIVYKI